jgi:hypothetical protein
MAGVSYVNVIPQNARQSGYKSFDTVDFSLQFPGMKMRAGSLRITGELEVTQGGAKVTTEKIQLDQWVGAHSLFQNISTRMGGQVIDNVVEYPRLVKMIQSATKTQSDFNNSEDLCALRSPSYQVARKLLRGERLADNTATGPDFSVRPLIAINSVLNPGETYLPFSKTGEIQLSVTMARIAEALFGADVGATTDYTVNDLRLRFIAEPDDGSPVPPLVMMRRMSIIQSFDSSLANIQTNVPMIATSVSSSFIRQAQQGSLSDNTLALEQVPNVDRVVFAFNNQTNELISYELRTPIEFTSRYIESIQDTGMTSAYPALIAANETFGLGADLGGNIDLSRNKFSMQIESAVNTADTGSYVAHMYFSGPLSM